MNIDKYLIHEYYNKKIYLLNCTKKINFYLDMQYYNKRFLTFKNKHEFRSTVENNKKNNLHYNTQYYTNNFSQPTLNRLSINRSNDNTNIPKRGTMPSYFPIIKKYNKNIENINYSISETHKRGTIPHYFPILKKCNTNINSSDIRTQIVFFRS